jgi:drug/metabolite transporter (DMT)-like permease
MYVPYRKAYLSGMNPLSFVTFFTFGELGMMSALAMAYIGMGPLWRELVQSRDVLFWLMLGGFIWVIGDIFQQYAAKYVGIGRGIPLSNSNQLWGLLWGLFVFGELHGSGSSTYAQVVGGSLLMMAGVVAIAFSSASGQEQAQWKEASHRESRRYNIAADFVDARMQGVQMADEAKPSRSLLDWFLVAIATAIFVSFATMARAPRLSFHLAPAVLLTLATVALCAVCGVTLWRTTRFN